jgi:hypothetical protein
LIWLISHQTAVLFSQHKQVTSNQPAVFLSQNKSASLFVWLVAGGWCWFVMREKYCWPVAGGWFVLREKYCWLVVNKPSEQGEHQPPAKQTCSSRSPVTFFVTATL